MGLPTAGDPAKLQAEVRAAAVAQNVVGTERQVPQWPQTKRRGAHVFTMPLKAPVSPTSAGMPGALP